MGPGTAITQIFFFENIPQLITFRMILFPLQINLFSPSRVKCQSRDSPGFDPSILQQSGI